MVLDLLLEHASPKSTAITLVVTLVIYAVFTRIIEERKIRSLGGHAPRTPSYAPLGLDIVWKAAKTSMNHSALEHWRDGFLKETSTIEMRVIGCRSIITAEPENIKAILTSQFQDYGKGKPFHKDFHDFLGDSIFTTDHDEWHASRQLIRPMFIKDRVSDLETFEKHVKPLIEAIANGGVTGSPGVASDNVGKGRVVDVGDLFFRFTLDAATDFLLGKSVDSLHTLQQPFAIAFAEVQRVQNLIARIGPANKLLSRKTFFDGLKVINEFVQPYIEQVLRLPPEELESKVKSDSDYTFLHALASFTRDRVVIRDQLVAVLLAGRDTTASALSWAFYELARHPEIYRKLRAEILDTVGPTALPTYEHLKNMKYLRHTMDETLRLYPVVPYNVRLALKDTTLPRGGGPDGLSPIGILKDTPIGYSALVMQRRPDLYPPGSDPLTFNPERWDSWQPKPWEYIPFNGGPRICIGQNFALTEMGYTIVRLLQRFERCDWHMESVDGGTPVLKAEITLQPGQGVKVGFWDAEKRA